MDGCRSLEDICRSKDIEEVIVSARTMDPDRLKTIREACRGANVTLKRAHIRIDPIDFG
jgi:hypothetical protein